MERWLEPLGRDSASDTSSLRLVNLGGPHLVTSQFRQGKFTQSLATWAEGANAGELKTVSVAADGLPTISCPPGPPPDWDALVHGDGSMAVVWTVVGSAVSHLSYKGRRNAVALTVNRGTPFGIFGDPRFVGGGLGDSVVAIASLSDQDPSVILFRQRPDGVFESPKPIQVSWRGIPIAAKLVQVSDGYLAFVKVIPPPGQVPTVHPRRIFGARLTQPGWLEVIWLDGDMKPARTSVMQSRTDVVFEFDVVAAGGRIALLTTTSTGGTLAFLDEQGNVSVDAVRSRPDPASNTEIHLASEGPLTSPSLLFSNRQLYVAAIRDAGPAARIVGTKIVVGP
jgi:hypothetical protein